MSGPGPISTARGDGPSPATAPRGATPSGAEPEIPTPLHTERWDASERRQRDASRPRSSGSRVVLVHGFTQTGRSWRGIAGPLARDHEVLTPDAPGHGGSTAVEVTDLWDAADRVVAAGGRATYVGYSMGGRLCLHGALARPDAVSALVLIGATAGIDSDDERASRRLTDDALAASIETDGVDAFLARWLAQPMFAELPDDPAERADRGRNTAAGLAAALRTMGTGTQQPLWGRLHELAMPVLCVAGARDTRFVAAAARMATAIGANARLVTVPGAGHAAHLEHPAEVIAIIRTAADAATDAAT